MHLVGNTHVTNATPTESHSHVTASPTESHPHVTASPENTNSTTSHLSGNTHLAGSRIISLHKLHDAIYTITQYSASCLSPVELVGEVQRNGLCSTLLAKCSKCNEEFMFKTCNKLELKKPDGTVRSTYQSNITAVVGQMATGHCNS